MFHGVILVHNTELIDLSMKKNKPQHIGICEGKKIWIYSLQAVGLSDQHPVWPNLLKMNQYNTMRPLKPDKYIFCGIG